MRMHLWSPRLIFLTLFFVIVSCSEKKHESIIPEVTELNDFETIVSNDDVILANPQRIRFDGHAGLIVFDSNLGKVVRLSLNGEVVNEIGRKGQGPGEYQSVSNITLIDDSIFLVDDRQFIIHRFSEDGTHIASLPYGDFGTHRINKPTVINQDNLLIPKSESDQDLFTLMNWNDEEFAQMGQVPEESTDHINYDVYRAAISNRTIFPYFKPHVFAVNNDGESVFIVYEAFPKISKYDLSGELLWQSESFDLPEIDLVADAYYNFMDMVLQQANAIQPLKKYVDGVSKNGKLFISTNTSRDNPLWIHEIDDNGNLLNRFTLKSETGLKSYFDIDTEGRRIFVLTDEAEIRAYHF